MAAVDVENALALGPTEIGPALLSLHEDQWFDRKSARISAADLANHLIGLANAEGGVIVVGLEKGVVQGRPPNPTRLNDWRQAPLDFTRPAVPARFRSVSCLNAHGAEDELVVVEVAASERVHENARGEVFLRVGDETRRLNPAQVQELIYDKGQSTFEASGVDADPEDLDLPLLSAYADAVNHPEPTRLLQARGLARPDGRLTVGALLLFGLHPQDRYPEAYVRVLRYRGTQRGTGARQQLLDDVRCEGPIPHVIDRARTEIASRLPTRQALGADGRFGPVGIVPEDAWLEGLVNAVIHRSYSAMGDHIRIEIFDDRIEFESPGRFPGLVDPSNPLAVTRFARNPRIARVCADLRFGQELGEGIRRMFEEMRLAGLADPNYTQTSGSVRLVLSSEPIDRELEARLPPGSRQIMRAIRDQARPSTGDIAAATGMSRPAAIKRLRQLAEEGMIERIGTSPKDPRAYWRLNS
ncbi:MAG: ATP-binding protein [Thermoleophilia bacterium]